MSYSLKNTWAMGIILMAGCILQTLASDSTFIIPSESNAYIASLNLSTTQRKGYFTFENGLVQDTNLAKLSLVGLSLGKRYSIRPWLDAQILGSLSRGSVDVHDYGRIPLSYKNSPDVTYHDVVLAYDFTFYSIQPELVLRLPATGWFSPCLHGGTTISYGLFSDAKYINDGTGLTREPVTLDNPISSRSFSAMMVGGVSLDILAAKTYGFSAWFSTRYGLPISYNFTSGMPLQGVKCRESFRTFEIGIAFMLYQPRL